MRRVLPVPVYTLMCTNLGLRSCAYRWTRSSGGSRWRHHLRGLLGVHWFAQMYALEFRRNECHVIGMMTYMLAFVDCPVSMVIMHARCKGHSREITGKIYVRLFFPVRVVLFSWDSGKRFWEFGILALVDW